MICEDCRTGRFYGMHYVELVEMLRGLKLESIISIIVLVKQERSLRLGSVLDLIKRIRIN